MLPVLVVVFRKQLLLARVDNNFALLTAAKQDGLLVDCLAMSAPIVVELEQGSQ